MSNVYFDLTAEFNREERLAILASGQAVVWHRLAIVSKDGDWILRETTAACRRVLELLGRQGARYRSGAPLDVRWLAGGWSSHFEFFDERGRRVRCDFFSRPPRLAASEVEALFTDATVPPVVPIEILLRLKQTQRAKDYAVIGELARRLPPEQELAWTTDVDRILELAPRFGVGSPRPSVLAALVSDRREVVRALAEEIDDTQRRDRERMNHFSASAAPYLAATARLSAAELTLPGGHERLVALAETLLPHEVEGTTP